jgi:hypothetical protein
MLLRARRTLVLALVALALSFAGTATAQAQTAVRILVKRTFPDSNVIALVRIDRTRDAVAIVALRADAANAQNLAAALRALGVLQEKLVEARVTRLSFELTESMVRAPADEAELRVARSLLARLRERPWTELPGVGRVSELAATVGVKSSARGPLVPPR